MRKSLVISGGLPCVALLLSLAAANQVDAAAINDEAQLGLSPQRTPPRTRDDPASQIDRGSRGLLDEERELSPGEDRASAEVGAGGVEILPSACELELALAAAPEHLRAGAGVFVLHNDGYRRVRDSANGFDCIVNRDHPRALKPTCFDTVGATVIVPKILEVGQWLLEGSSAAELQQRVEYGFVSGQFRAPSRPGVAYMLSNYNRPWFPESETLGRFPPHVMFYAPELTNEQIGFDPEAFAADRRLPLVAYQGPHGFIIMITGENRARSKGELKDCPTWVWK